MGADLKTLKRLRSDDPKALDAINRVTQNPAYVSTCLIFLTTPAAM